jgi:hypothetical protein
MANCKQLHYFNVRPGARTIYRLAIVLFGQPGLEQMVLVGKEIRFMTKHKYKIQHILYIKITNTYKKILSKSTRQYFQSTYKKITSVNLYVNITNTYKKITSLNWYINITITYKKITSVNLYVNIPNKYTKVTSLNRTSISYYQYAQNINLYEFLHQNNQQKITSVNPYVNITSRHKKTTSVNRTLILPTRTENNLSESVP